MLSALMPAPAITTPTTSPPQSTRTLLLGIWGHLSRRRRIQLGLLLVVMLASGGAELVSLGAVLPFLAVLSDPERLWQQPLVQALAARVGFTEASELLLPGTLAFAAAAVLAALIRLANLWLNGRLAAAVGSDLSCEAYRRTLYQRAEPPGPAGVHRHPLAVSAAGTRTAFGPAGGDAQSPCRPDTELLWPTPWRGRSGCAQRPGTGSDRLDCGAGRGARSGRSGLWNRDR